MRAKAPFLVPVAGVTEGNKEFSFLQSMQSELLWGAPWGVFLTTMIGTAQGDMVLWIIPTSNIFLLPVSDNCDV